MKKISLGSGVLFGVVMVALCFAIFAETILRKFFSVSLGGVDELGGYALAVAALLAFLVTAIEQAHIRINILHSKMGIKARGVLNCISMASLAAFALFLLYFAVETVLDTITYQSIAQTPWATPLIYPQAAWLAATIVFAVGALVLAGRACALLLRADWQALDRKFGPSTPEGGLQEELDDLKSREGEF
ncbi:TRAP transporter small permease subunit [Castellaniella hirudinis]|uniref:TRAP transporter small permease protein n=1 Tax=Castellaniella hirudinis TaxID=1144617 RepID=A0ABV8S2Q0_9BURK